LLAVSNRQHLSPSLFEQRKPPPVDSSLDLTLQQASSKLCPVETRNQDPQGQSRFPAALLIENNQRFVHFFVAVVRLWLCELIMPSR